MKLIPEAIREAYTYDAATGRMFNRKGRACTAKVTNGNYLKMSFRGVEYLQHRVAWFLYHDEQPPEQIDHHDGSGLNNAASNLRPADNSTNQMNIGATAKSSTGIKGIFPIRGGTLYRAEVCINGARYQKHAVDPAKLVTWVAEMRRQLHGDYAHD